MSETENPFAAPQSDVNIGEDTTYTPKVWSFEGRIGRLRYLAYGMGATLALYALIGIAVGIAGAMGSETALNVAMFAMFIPGIILIVFSIAWAKRRLNDMNASGWLVLLTLIPIVGFIVYLVLLFAPGTKTNNNYGAPAVPNHAGIYILGLLPIPIIGILAAIAIPAYQDYVERASEYSLDVEGTEYQYSDDSFDTYE